MVRSGQELEGWISNSGQDWEIVGIVAGEARHNPHRNLKFAPNPKCARLEMPLDMWVKILYNRLTGKTTDQ